MLSKRTTQIPVGGGVEEGVSDVLFDAPLVRALVNGRIEKTGAVQKRYGETVLSASLPSTSTYGEHNAIVDQDGRAVVLTQLGAYAHDKVKDAWTQLGAVAPRPSRALTDRLIRQNNSSAEPEMVCVTVNGKTIACAVWSDIDLQDSYYAFFEVPADGGQMRVISGPTLFGGTRKMAYGIRLAVIGTTVYAIGGDNSAVTDTYHCSCDVSSSYAFSTPATTAWAATFVPIALLTDATNLWAVGNESGGGYSIRKLSTAFVQAADEIVAGAAALDAIKTSGKVVVIKHDGSLDEHTDTLPGAPTNHAVVTVGAGGPLYSTAVKATLVEVSGGAFFCAWERPQTSQPMESFGVVIASVSAAWAVSASGVVGSVCLAGRAAYRSSEGLPLLPIIDVVNVTYWRAAYIGRPTTGGDGLYTLAEVCRFSTDVAQYQPGTTSGARSTSRTFVVANVLGTHPISELPSLVYDSASGQWLLPHLVLSDVATPGFGGSFIVGIDVLRLATTAAPAERAVSASELRVLGGGCGATYLDGPVHAEMTPPPIGLYNTDQANDLDSIRYAGNVAEANLDYILAARWRDEKGNLHRGAPLFVKSESMWDDATTPDTACRVRFPRPFPQTIRGDKGGQSYEVEVYVAAAPAGPFYFADVVTPKRHPSILGVDYILINDPRGGGGGINSTLITDGMDHVAFVYDVSSIPASAVQRWTETEELVHVPCPPTIDLCSTQSRVWLLLGEQGRNVVRPSKLLTPGYAPEFPSDLDVVIPSEGGECRAIAALNDKVVVFKERLIYVLFGDPGDNTGANASLETPRLVQGDVGALEAQSVVEGPFGVVFRSSAAGFHLLAPDLTVTRLPQLEDTLGDYTILSGALVADRKEVRWATRSGSSYRTLVWDYEANAWLTHTHSLGAVANGVVGGAYSRVASGGSVYVERDAFSASLDLHEMTVTSAWFKLAGLQGFKRVWKVVFLLRWYSGDLGITLAYNYDEGQTSTHSWTAAQLAALADTDGRVSLVCHCNPQKVESFRFSIADDYSGQSPVTGAGFTLLGVACEWGAKMGSAAHQVSAGARR